jgi:hypothetical protein
MVEGFVIEGTIVSSMYPGEIDEGIEKPEKSRSCLWREWGGEIEALILKG